METVAVIEEVSQTEAIVAGRTVEDANEDGIELVSIEEIREAVFEVGKDVARKVVASFVVG